MIQKRSHTWPCKSDCMNRVTSVMFPPSYREILRCQCFKNIAQICRFFDFCIVFGFYLRFSLAIIIRLCIWVCEASEPITNFSLENALISFDLPNWPSHFRGAFSENQLFSQTECSFYFIRI